MGTILIQYSGNRYWENDSVAQIWLQILCNVTREKYSGEHALGRLVAGVLPQVEHSCLLGLDLDDLVEDEATRQDLATACGFAVATIESYGPEISVGQLGDLFGNPSPAKIFTRNVSTCEILDSIKAFIRLLNHEIDISGIPTMESATRTIYPDPDSSSNDRT